MLALNPFRQTPGFCGPASLKIVLDYYGIQKSESELAKMCNTSSRNGTKAANIVKAAKKMGFLAQKKDFSEIKDIELFLKKGVPVIVNWFSTDEGHYSVVQEIRANKIGLQDPELGKERKMDLKTFFRVWFDFEGSRLDSKKQLVVRRLIAIQPKKN